MFKYIDRRVARGFFYSLARYRVDNLRIVDVYMHFIKFLSRNISKSLQIAYTIYSHVQVIFKTFGGKRGHVFIKR